MDQNGYQGGSQHTAHDSALSVGSSTVDDAAKIKDLESEVRFLAEKATATSQRFADYENEIRVLQAQLRQQQRRNNDSAGPNDGGDATQGSGAQPEKPGIPRFGSFMHSRKASPIQANAVPSSREKELEATVVKEQTARIAAEKKVREMSAEIEELSESLFQQANEMVATERRENAALKDKITTLEQQLDARQGSGDAGALDKENARLKERLKILEQRDADRRRRLERLEAANKRIERVRSVLIPR